MTVFGWRLSKVLGFCFCGVLMPGFLIWRMETGDDPDRTLGFAVSGCVTGGFARVLYELIRARGAYKLLVYDKRRSNPLLLPLVTVMGLVGWSGQSGEPWRWAYPLLPIATWASTLRASPRPPQASGRSQSAPEPPGPAVERLGGVTGASGDGGDIAAVRGSRRDVTGGGGESVLAQALVRRGGARHQPDPPGEPPAAI